MIYSKQILHLSANLGIQFSNLFAHEYKKDFYVRFIFVLCCQNNVLFTLHRIQASWELHCTLSNAMHIILHKFHGM